MSKDDKTENTQAASESQSTDRGYTFDDLEKRRLFREYINGNRALRQRVIQDAIKRVEERTKPR